MPDKEKEVEIRKGFVPPELPEKPEGEPPEKRG